MEKSGKYTIYKKFGALQASIIPPQRNDKGWIDKEGAVLIEVAPGSGPQKWDWEQKINFAIGIPDICKLAENPETPPKLVHAQGDTTKTLEFTPGEGQYAGTYMLNVFQKTNTGNHSVKVPLTSGEFSILCRMLAQMAPYLIGWL